MVDGTLAETGMLTTHGEELFPCVFKLTNYDDLEYSVTNTQIRENELLPVTLVQMDLLERKLSSLKTQY